MRFLLFGFFLIFIIVSAYADSYILSPEEEQYLLSHPEIHFVSQTSYPPFEFLDDDGERQGMCIELVRWMSTEFGFQAIFTDMTFQEAQGAILNGDADVLTSFFYSQSRDSLFDFTETMYEIPARIYIQSGTTDIAALADLTEKIVAVQGGDYAIDFLQTEGIECTLVYADNFTDALHLLLNGEVDALVGDEQIIEYHLSSHYLKEDVVAVGDTLYVGLNCMSVAEGESLLCSIIDKGIEHAKEIGILEGIKTKWQGNPIRISEKSGFRYTIHMLVVLGLFIIAAVLILFWNLRLRHLVEQRTRSLKESENRLDQALDQAYLGSWDCDIQTGEVVNNDRYSLMLGYFPGEMDFSYTGWLKLVHPDDRDILESRMDEFLAKNTERFECEFRMKTKNGEWRSIHSCGGTVERDRDGKPVRIAGIHQDITRRKLSESLLRKAVDDWRNTFDALPELIAVLDSEGTVIRVNRAQALALNMTREECIGKKLCTLILPDDYTETSCIQNIFLKETGLPLLREMRLDKLDGDFEVSMAVSKDIEDGSVRIMHVARNITARKSAEKIQKEMEKRVQHAQKLESLGVLAGGIAHDFNNILMSIRGYTDLAISSVKGEEPAFEYLEEINRSVRIASELSGQMLAYSGRGNFVVETVYLNDIIENMKPMFQVSVSRKADVHYHLDKNLPSVKVDSTQMEQVILNLVTNASEAIGSSRGTITISTGVERAQPPGSTDLEEEGFLFACIQVEDTGDGMSDDVIHKLFEPFFTTKFTGRGLGMAVVHGIVEGHGGFIEVRSKIGIGSSIKVFIPAAEGIKTKEASEENDESSVFGETAVGILIVDDEKNILFIGKLALKKAGYTVFTAENGERAIDVYKENKDVIQCVILDLTMPVMDGVECLKELKQFDPGVKVILSSGYNQQDVENRIHSDDIAGYLKKPYGLKTLRKAVKSVLGD